MLINEEILFDSIFARLLVEMSGLLTQPYSYVMCSITRRFLVIILLSNFS